MRLSEVSAAAAGGWRNTPLRSSNLVLDGRLGVAALGQPAPSEILTSGRSILGS